MKKTILLFACILISVKGFSQTIYKSYEQQVWRPNSFDKYVKQSTWETTSFITITTEKVKVTNVKGDFFYYIGDKLTDDEDVESVSKSWRAIDRDGDRCIVIWVHLKNARTSTISIAYLEPHRFMLTYPFVRIQ